MFPMPPVIKQNRGSSVTRFPSNCRQSRVLYLPVVFVPEVSELACTLFEGVTSVFSSDQHRTCTYIEISRDLSVKHMLHVLDFRGLYLRSMEQSLIR